MRATRVKAKMQAAAAAGGGTGPSAPSKETIEILKQLIGFRTVSRHSNLDLIEWVRAYLSGFGIASHLIYDGGRSRANLFATIGDGRRGGLVLSGHTDVVAVDGQEWSTDPFEAVAKDERIYGRGAADMKGFIAAVLAAIPQMLTARRAEPLHLALSFDEEVGCIGVRSLIGRLAALGIAPQGCIIGEPTEMRVVVGYKGSGVYRCTVHGREMHSSLAPQGVNAIEYAALLILKLREIQDRLRRSEPKHDGFDIRYTTVNPGSVQGGLASNVVAGDCEFRFDIRHLPWTAAEGIVAELETFARDELLPEMHEIAPEAAIQFVRMGDVPAMQTDADTRLVRDVQRLAGDREPAGYVGFGTEAGLFQKAGIPTVVCGPGSIAQAHRPDDFITFQQLAQCEAFLRRLTNADDIGAR